MQKSQPIVDLEMLTIWIRVIKSPAVIPSIPVNTVDTGINFISMLFRDNTRCKRVFTTYTEAIIVNILTKRYIMLPTTAYAPPPR
jgi:hypothetical protein